MKDLQENIVPAENQNRDSYFTGGKNGIRILFVGNSISKHGPKPDMGWNGNWGMAASSEDKDYLHLIVEKIKKYDPAVSFSIAQVAGYERNFFTVNPAAEYARAVDFQADIIVMFFGANVAKEYESMENPPKTFGEAYEELRNALVGGRDGVYVFHSEGFYIRPKLEKEKIPVAEKYGDPYIKLGDIQTREDTHGRYNHPSDLGMQEIADLFWQYIEPAVKRITGK